MMSSPKKQAILFGLFFIAAVLLGSTIRLYPYHAFVPGDSSEKATMIIIARLKAQVGEQVNARYPNLAERERAIIEKNLFDKILHEESGRVRASIQQLASTIPNEAARETPYLLASDSYYYFDLTKHVLKNGHLGGPRQGSKYYNPNMLAPKGHFEPFTLHPFIGAALYRIMAFFSPDTDLMHAASLTPVILTTAALAAFFAVAGALGCGAVPTFTAGIFFLCAPAFVKRSMYGWYDNDPYSLIFPSLVLACLFIAFRSNGRRKLIWGAIAAFFIFLYSLFWQGWVFLFAVIVAGCAVSLIFQALTRRSNQQFRGAPALYAIVIVGSFGLITLIFGAGDFFVLFREGWRAITNFMTPQLSVWPDLFISVGELSRVPFEEFIHQTGGPFFFAGSLFGIVTSLYIAARKPAVISPHVMIFLCVFYAASFVISTGAQRFSLFCVTPFSLAFLLGLENIRRFILERWSRRGQWAIPARAVISLGMLSLIILPVRDIQKEVPTLLNQIYNTTWDRAMTDIRTTTEPDAIINAWWPPGHFIKAMGERRVTFDGATINFPQAYWMANVFLSTRETDALGLLRMLNSSANQAADFLGEIGFSVAESVFIIKEITKLDAFKARLLLSTRLKDNNLVDKLLSFTHGTPPPSYLMIYHENIDDNIQFKFIGDWNMKRIEEINANPRLLRSVPDRDSPEYVRFLWELAGGPYKYSGPLIQLSQSDNIAQFEHNIRVNLKTYDSVVDSPKFGAGIPQSIFYPLDGQIAEKTFNNATLPYSLLMYRNGERFNVVLMDQPLARSMIMRLFFYQGDGMNYIEPVSRSTDLTQRTDIQLYRVDWEKFLQAERNR